MVLINKNIAAALGYAVFGRAVFGLNFESQYIPAELYDGAVDLGLIARPEGIVSRRYPFRIDQPGTPDQRAVWDRFTRCNVCWHQQPWEGGATPPAWGPRNRHWWWFNSPIHDPIYRNWFMQQTLLEYIENEIPRWCMLFVADGATVNSRFPNTPGYGAGDWEVEFSVFGGEIYIKQRIFLKTPGYFSKYLYLYMHTTQPEPPVRKIAVHKQDSWTFDLNTITWNNKPALGPKIKTFYLPFDWDIWVAIEIGAMEALCIKVDDETVDEDEFVQYHSFYAEVGAPFAERPFLLP